MNANDNHDGRGTRGAEMMRHAEMTDAEVRTGLKTGTITMAGHDRLRIYGELTCWSGIKMMSRARRVFFTDAAEALAADYRPCGHCMREEYKAWKASQAKVA